VVKDTEDRIQVIDTIQIREGAKVSAISKRYCDTHRVPDSLHDGLALTVI
jgi:hypothetical protein